ncbi:16S rRNA (uracil(1498)-N(3))-methyltransferase [Ruicaihuangia caeni]|uniref:Ribosomal RNA small subunit methyltransferase E n=1 Tax=Ruicaihuangia caeni TaxID=3042517 RepID=A0AAW6T3B6_9MICO|nr:16S rRNA (uracil(1498)-N(3))-methyltransferase [Klugiella sp. YN-L-19]MDI2097934.1 16S rRNA (uracil(1498)-N(3))-methyltransferase [Klugiella sp. YN-L-19]
MAHLYLSESLDTAAVGDHVAITGAEARHAVTVGRVRVGERLQIGNGRGLIAHGAVMQADAASLLLEVDEVVVEPAPAPKLLLVQALAKGDRDELAVQAATELGVDAVIPWQAARSISRWAGPKAEKGVTRWRTIAREASKQSLRAWVPEIHPVHDTRAVSRRTERLVVLEPTASASIDDVQPDGRDLALVVGPEGGISPDELRTLAEAGAEFARLGRHVLRTSTAGPAAIAALSGRLGRW